MANINFGSLASVSVSSSNRLKPFNIYDVKFIDAKVEDLTSKDNRKFKVIKMNFSGEDGTYEHSYFVPEDSAESTKNSEGPYGKQPSKYEHFVAFMAHTLGNLSPEGYAKLQEASGKIDSFDKMAAAFVAVLNKYAKDVTCKLRLSGRKYANPDGSTGWTADANNFLAAFNKSGQFYVANKKGFINNTAAWSQKEAGLKAEYESYSPTAMGTPTGGKGSEDVVNLDVPTAPGLDSNEIDDLLGTI